MEKTPAEVTAELKAQLEAKLLEDDNKQDKPSEELVPHQAIVTITAAISRQLPNGAWAPRSAFNDSFFLIVQGNSEKEVTDNLIKKLEELKAKWAETDGHVGLLSDSQK